MGNSLEDIFPNNVVIALAEAMENRVDGLRGVVLKRPLRKIDPGPSVGIFAVDWRPESYDIGKPDPAIHSYLFGIQALVKNGDEEIGRLEHGLLSKMVRVMLYRDDSLRVRLSGLTDTTLGVTERTLRWGVRQQRYIANEIQGTFLYLSTTEVWLETEST